MLPVAPRTDTKGYLVQIIVEIESYNEVMNTYHQAVWGVSSDNDKAAFTDVGRARLVWVWDTLQREESAISRRCLYYGDCL